MSKPHKWGEKEGDIGIDLINGSQGIRFAGSQEGALDCGIILEKIRNWFHCVSYI